MTTMAANFNLLEQAFTLNHSHGSDERLRILFACAAPDSTSRIRVDKEFREIKNCIKAGPFRDLFLMEDVLAARPIDLYEALLRSKPHILHFSGHGSGEALVLEGENDPSLLQVAGLAQSLAAIPDDLRLVVLNACYSALEAEQICNSIDAVVGMRDKIPDASAITFSSILYLAIGFGRNLEESFKYALAAIKPPGSPQSANPVLLSKQGIRPSQIYPLSWLTATTLSRSFPVETPDTEAAIQAEIILFSHDGSERQSWRYLRDGEVTILENSDDYERLEPDELWQRLGSKLHQPGKGLPGTRLTEPDIFVLLRDNPMLNLSPYPHHLEKFIEEARRATDGTDLYLVYDSEVSFNNLYRKQDALVIDRWFRMLVTSGITDVIELSAKSLSTTSYYDLLREGARRSSERRVKLRRLVSGDEWMVELRPEAKALKRFLERFTEQDLDRGDGGNLAVFYDQKPHFGWTELLDNSQKRNCCGRWFVAALTRAGVDHLSYLRAKWPQEAARRGVADFDDVIEFGGIFEWLYAMCRLHRATQLAQQYSRNIAVKAMF